MSLLFYYTAIDEHDYQQHGSVLLSSPLTLDVATNSDEVHRLIEDVIGPNYHDLVLTLPDCFGCREQAPNQEAHECLGY